MSVNKTNESVAKKWIRLRSRVEAAQRESDRAEGALKQFEREMSSQYGTKNMEDLKNEVDQLLQEEHKLMDQLEEKLRAFEAKWESKLE